METLGLSPAFVIAYGPSGTGKSSECLWAAAASGVFIVAHPDGLTPVFTTLQVPLQLSQVRIARTLTEAYQVLYALVVVENPKRIADGLQPWKFIVVDDLSMLAENEINAMKTSGKYTKGNGFSYDMWTDMMTLIVTFGQVARWAGVHVLMNAHEREPGFDAEGKFHRGGPWLPSLKEIKKLPHAATEVLKIEHEPGGYLFPVIMRAEPDASWEMKSRYNLRGSAPFNLAEWLRLQGHPIPRPVGLEWIEEWVATIAKRIGEGQNPITVAKKAKDILIAKGRPDAHAYWAIRDGVHRAVYFKLRGSMLAHV